MHADTASAYERLGLFSDAAREYRQALQLCPGFADLRTRLAHLYRENGQQEEAAEQYRQAVDRSPSYVPARLHLGVTLFALGRKEEARAEWEAVLEIDAENRNAQFYLKTLDSDLDS
jgi:tetratricopeptide (TPR) repeat protein